MILCDLDGVLLDFIGPLCDLLNEGHSGHLLPGHFLKYELEHTLVGSERAAVKQWMQDGTLARARKWYPGGQRFLRSLQDAAPVTILTAGGPGDWNAITTDFLAKGQKSSSIVFAKPLEKVAVKGSVLIEDHPDTADLWAEANKAFSVLIDRPWNRSAITGRRVRRARSYEHAITLVQEILS